MNIGILGGSFNPVHNGHLRLAIETMELLELDWVELVPAAVPPHKTNVRMLPFHFRLMLLELAVSVCPCLKVNDLEGRRPGPSYTVDTLQEYRQIYPNGDFYFILGSQDLLTLPGWREWNRLVALTHFAVIWRKGSDINKIQALVDQHFPGSEKINSNYTGWRLPFGKEIIILQIPDLEISSTLVRKKWQQGKFLNYLLPEGVEEALKEYGGHKIK